MEIAATEYGLSSRIKLKQIAPNNIAIVKLIKSRIIQKDALKIIEIANTIHTKDSTIRISLICNDNICSKSVKLLNEHAIEILFKTIF